MYEKFDRFLNVETWYTRHPLDEARFFRVLDTVVKDIDFNPDEMASYFRNKLRVSVNNSNHYLNGAIDHYRDAAWAVKSYLDVIGKST